MRASHESWTVTALRRGARAMRDFASRVRVVPAEEVLPPPLNEITALSLGGPESVRLLFKLARSVVSRGVPGDFVECGVYNGGSAAAVACAYRGAGRHVWLYDSFQGMPPVSAVDGAFAAQHVGGYVGSLDRVREAMRLAGLNESEYTVRPGWFADTFQEAKPQQISFLHIDCDWYDSVMLTLETFFDAVVDDGVVLLDDFGHLEGCREAFYDFTSRRGIKPLVERHGHTQLWWVKGREHNRDDAEGWDYR